MERLKQEIESARKEQADLKTEYQWAFDAWCKVTKEMNALPSGHPDLKKKEKDCDNQNELVKQLSAALNQVENNLQRLSQNLLFFFEEDWQDLYSKKSSSKPESRAATTSSAESSRKAESSTSKDKESKETKNGSDMDKVVNAFRKNLLGYCHGSHGVGEDIDTWKEKLPALIKRAEKRMPEEQVASYKALVSGNMSSVESMRKKLILWYVEHFPHERKPIGYYEAAGLPMPKKKGGDKKEGKEGSAEEEPAAKPEKKEAKETKSEKKETKSSKPAQTPPPSASKTAKKLAEPSSSEDDSSSEEEEAPVVKKPKVMSEPPKKKEQVPPPKKDKKEEKETKKESEPVKKKHKKEEPETDEEEEEEEEEEAPAPEEETEKKKHHKHKHQDKNELTRQGSGRKSKA